MNESPSEPLSSSGEARREAMLDELVALAQRTHRRRRVRRRVVAVAGVAFLVVLLRLTMPGTFDFAGKRSLVEDPAQAPTDTTVVEHPSRRGGETLHVQTDRSVVERFRAEVAGCIVPMDDRMLLETLASINRPAEIIREGDHVRLSVSVTDRALGIRQ